MSYVVFQLLATIGNARLCYVYLSYLYCNVFCSLHITYCPLLETTCLIIVSFQYNFGSLFHSPCVRYAGVRIIIGFLPSWILMCTVVWTLLTSRIRCMVKNGTASVMNQGHCHSIVKSLLLQRRYTIEFVLLLCYIFYCICCYTNCLFNFALVLTYQLVQESILSFSRPIIAYFEPICHIYITLSYFAFQLTVYVGY